jgi:ubiquinone/menaquinone biosynthesis C-methylase UbiE
MGVWEAQVLPRVIDKMLGNAEMAKVRSRSLGDLHGTVVEVGFGSGPNVPLYPEAVTKVYAVDPSTVGRELAAGRLAASSVPVEFIGLDGQLLPLADDSVDCALSTWTLCTIPDAAAALAELRRVIRPGGELFFLEHGRSPVAKVRTWQRRLEPVQRRVAGGCHLTRDIPELVAGSGFEVERLVEFDIAGPKAMSHMFSGMARNPA